MQLIQNEDKNVIAMVWVYPSLTSKEHDHYVDIADAINLLETIKFKKCGHVSMDGYWMLL